MIASTQTQHPLAPAIDSGRPPVTATQAHQRLKRLGVRMTKPRQAILEALFAEREPIAIDTLHVCDRLATSYAASGFSARMSE